MLRTDMKALAKERLRGQWANAIVIMILSGLLTGAAGFLGMILGPFSFLVTMAVSGPVLLGTVTFYMKVSREEQAGIGDLLNGFKDFVRAFLLFFLQTLFILLWSLLLVIPGIMKAYSYSMAFYIMSDDPGISASEAIKKSKEMMKGHRMELFVLQLSFIGWEILAIVTCGIGNFYVLPYMNETVAFFYRNLAENSIQTESREKEVLNRKDTGTDRQANHSSKLGIPTCNTQGETEVLSSDTVNYTTVLNPSSNEGTFTGLKGALKGLCYALEDGVEYSIGRDGAVCGIVIDNGNASISRLHCTIQYVASQNGYYVTDQSSNGTFADGVRLPKEQAQLVWHGTVITLGNQEEGFCLE